MDIVEDAHPHYTSITTKVMIQKELRGTRLAINLLQANYKQLLTKGIKFDFIDCDPTMITFFKRIGYQTIDTVNHPEYGESIVMKLDLLNFKHLKIVNSLLNNRPLAKVGQEDWVWGRRSS